MTKSQTEIVARARAAVERGGIRSPITEWLTRHYDALVPVIAQAERPDWVALAATLAADGVRGARGQLPSGDTVRKTWTQVAERAARRKVQHGWVSRPTSSGITFLADPEPSAPPQSKAEESPGMAAYKRDLARRSGRSDDGA